MHRPIKNFYLKGQLAETNLVNTKERLTKTLEDQMRDCGYAPVLDLDPHFTMDYDDLMGRFNFKLTVYGSWVGEKAWEIDGIMNGNLIPKYIPPSKSKPS